MASKHVAMGYALNMRAVQDEVAPAIAEEIERSDADAVLLTAGCPHVCHRLIVAIQREIEMRAIPIGQHSFPERGTKRAAWDSDDLRMMGRQSMQLKDIMTANVEVIGPDASVEEAAAKMKRLNVGSIPVCDGQRLLGMITDRDVTTRVTADGRDPRNTKTRDVMTPHVVYCYDDQDVSEAAKLMAEKQIRRLVILDRGKQLVGIVSLGDLAVDAGDEKLIARAVEGVSEPSEPTR